MFLSTLTWVHTILSLVALATGIVVLRHLLGATMSESWTTAYLTTAIATSVTGFAFPFERFGPSHWVGVASLIVFAVAILARYGLHLAGVWRVAYAVSIVLGVYFLVFVSIAQAFMKVPALHALAPTLSEPAFVLAQVVALLLFGALAVGASLSFRPLPALGARA